MNDTPQPTRQQWYRLGPDRRSTENERSMGSSSSGLRSIAPPENHDGMDLSQLPPLREALLSAEQIRQLFGDIESCASSILLMRRAAQSRQGSALPASTPSDLTAALEALLSGQIPRLQVRYHWERRDWIDTIETRERGFRLVRIAHRRPVV